MGKGVDTSYGSAKPDDAFESNAKRLPVGRCRLASARTAGRRVSQLGLALLAGLGFLAPMLAAADVDYECVVDGRTVQRTQEDNGRVADASGHPWHVALFKGRSFGCSGVLLGAEWVLTAGRCVADVSPADLAVGYGEGDLRDFGTAERYTVREVLVHPAYDPAATMKNDIALLRLAVPVASARNSYANLPLEAETAALERSGTCAVVTGWFDGGYTWTVSDSALLRAHHGSIVAVGEGMDDSGICVSGPRTLDFNAVSGGVVTVGGLANRPRWLVGIGSPEPGACGDGALRSGLGAMRVMRVAHYREWIESIVARPREWEWRSPLGMEFVWVPAGTFVMGSPADEEGRVFDEGPMHEVRISQGFWMGKYEVTLEEWWAVMGESPYYPYACGSPCPVANVSWDDVQEFIRRLNKREFASGYRYRLPTEAEWEYAARAGASGAHYRKQHEKANGWGLHRMLTSVDEWTADWYGQYPSGTVTDPRGPGEGWGRVRRGGPSSRWSNRRFAARRLNSPGYSSKSIGFRLVRTE